jgi:hypothetical protein
MRIPDALVEEWRHEPDWLVELPRLAAECAELWSLDLEEPIDTPHSPVVPTGEAVLKLNAPSHFEADHEAEALARWAGDGAVRLLTKYSWFQGASLRDFGPLPGLVASRPTTPAKPRVPLFMFFGLVGLIFLLAQFRAVAALD